MIIVVTVLSVLGIGYVRLAAHRQTAPPQPAGPGATAGDSPFTAEAAAAVARLQAKVGDAYTATHLWQAASALSATIGFMHATGSQAYLGDLNATYQAHHRGDTFRDNYYDDEGWWVLTWIRAYGLTGDRAYLRQAKSVFAALTKGMRRNAVAVWARDRRGSSFGLDWAGPFRASTITAQASALDLLTTQIPALARPASPLTARQPLTARTDRPGRQPGPA